MRLVTFTVYGDIENLKGWRVWVAAVAIRIWLWTLKGELIGKPHVRSSPKVLRPEVKGG